ncbi:unnamed protein product [Prorocentrum cordatum]|uniref:EF-hand domain-containing protein n=1 Tax=Prorocentrum cordatum TaxID=2364126 RepID=A0ABN9U0S0_9DINO|nr:unnamed protein product [Polarella glacialis]
MLGDRRAPAALPALLPGGAGAAPRSVSKEFCPGLPRLGVSGAWAPVFEAHRQSRVSVGAESNGPGRAAARPRTAEPEGALAAATIVPRGPAAEAPHDLWRRSMEAADRAALAQPWGGGPGAAAGPVQSARPARPSCARAPEGDGAAKSILQRRSDSTPAPTASPRQSTEAIAPPAASGSSTSAESGERPSSGFDLESEAQEELLWEEIYGKLKDRDIGEVHTDMLGRALDLVGFSHPNPEWVSEIAPQITHYSTLGQQEFFQFIEAYSRKQADFYAVAFQSCDRNKSGRLELEELPYVFDVIKIDVMPHVLREFFEEVCNGEGSIDIKGFMKMIELNKLREGFSRNEFEDLLHVFDLFDVDKSDSIDATEFANMLSWLGFSWSREHDFGRPSLKRDAREVYDAADVDGSGSLNQREFIICMRRVRSLEEEKVRRVMRQNAMPGAADRVQHAHLPQVFKALGYNFPDRQAIFEFAQDCFGSDVHHGLDIGQVWQVVVQYRSRHGFSAAMKAEIQAAFDACKLEHEVDIDHAQMPLVLRRLGIALPLHVQRHITERVDVRSTGRVDLESAVRVVRLACEHRLAQAGRLFRLHREGGPGGRAVIAEAEALGVLEEGLGLDAFDGGAAAWGVPPEDLAPGAGERLLSEEGFFRTYSRLAEKSRRRLQANGGLSSGELNPCWTSSTTTTATGRGSSRTSR